MLGLTAVLGFIFGALGGVWSARRVVVSRMEEQMKDAAALGYMGGTAADPLMGDDADASAWAEDDSEFPTVRRHAAEMNENKPVSPAQEVAEAGVEAGPAEEGAAETEDASDRGPSLDDLRATSEAWARDRDGTVAEDAQPEPEDAGSTTPESGPRVAGDDAAQSPGADAGTAEEEALPLDDELDHSSDFYHSLAKLYIESGWPHDAEELMREVIEQNPDKAVYRALLLEALYHMGSHEQFLEEFNAYQALADKDDPSWTWVLAMGKILLPDNPAFAEGDDDMIAAVTLEQAADGESEELDAPQADDEELVFEVGEGELRDSEEVDLDHPEYLWSDLELNEEEPDTESESASESEPKSESDAELEPEPASESEPGFGSAWQSEWEAEPESDDFPELTPEESGTPEAAEDDPAAEPTDGHEPDQSEDDASDEERRLAGGGSSGSS